MNHTARDGLGRALIAMLEENARMSATEIARRLGIARSTVNDRIARLEREGVIIGYSAIVRQTEAEGETQAMLNLTCERSLGKQIVAALRDLPEVKCCYSVSGAASYTCMVEVPWAEDLDALIGEIVAIRGVTSVDSTMILATKFCRGIDRINQKSGHLREVA